MYTTTIAQSSTAAASPSSAARGTTRDGAQTQVFFAVVLLIGIVLIGAIVIFLLRRRLFRKDTSADGAVGLMENLRHMRDSGQITPEEYDLTRKAMTRRASGGARAQRAGPAPPRLNGQKQHPP